MKKRNEIVNVPSNPSLDPIDWSQAKPLPPVTDNTYNGPPLFDFTTSEYDIKIYELERRISRLEEIINNSSSQ